MKLHSGKALELNHNYVTVKILIFRRLEHADNMRIANVRGCNPCVARQEKCQWILRDIVCITSWKSSMSHSSIKTSTNQSLFRHHASIMYPWQLPKCQTLSVWPTDRGLLYGPQLWSSLRTVTRIMTTPLSVTCILPVIQHPPHVHPSCSFRPIFFLATNRTAQLSIPVHRQGFIQLVKARIDSYYPRESAPATTPTHEAAINPSPGSYCYCVITNITYTHITALLESGSHHKSCLKQLVSRVNKHK